MSVIQQEDITSEGRKALKVLLLLVMGGAFVVIVFALQSLQVSSFVSILGVGVMTAGASLLLGGLIGFLFGIPKTLQQDGSTDVNTKLGNVSNKGAIYRANTNLEQISDWLTKILVGVGLTQLTSLPEGFSVISENLSVGLGGFESSGILGVALIVYYLICGFLIGFLWTRLNLIGEFKKADSTLATTVLSEQIAVLDKMESQLDEKGKRQIQEIRLNTERKLASLPQDGTSSSSKKIRQFAKEYEQIRRTMSSGRERTFKMSTLMAQVRALAIQSNFEPQIILDFYHTGSLGNRVVALNILSVMKYPECFDIILDSIGGSKSAFEQYAALKAAENIIDNLNRDQKERLVEVVKDQRSRGPEKYITPDSDRWAISERILAVIVQPQD
ncbi:hypothetical protein [Fodinibius sediminis]|uniref:Uncharacterized protein n=1 Tax=Fodinibius sediminis TaxID=1214077 RepID=A0A521EDV2_9BACT|nr:hypothetical protein [Fodinibius sediminis]SMO82055.1 hypothetical protein SAMN06265218_11578 [Fodinibius sediminis]